MTFDPPCLAARKATFTEFLNVLSGVAGSMMPYRGRGGRGEYRGRGRGRGRGTWRTRGRGNGGEMSNPQHVGPVTSAPVVPQASAPGFPPAATATGVSQGQQDAPSWVIDSTGAPDIETHNAGTNPANPTPLVTGNEPSTSGTAPIPVESEAEETGGEGREEEEEREGEDGEEGDKKQGRTVSLQQQTENFELSPEDLMKINKQIIMALHPRSENKFFCTICLSAQDQHNVMKHINCVDHLRKVKLSLFADQKSDMWCKCCCTMMTSEMVKTNHLEGKKHKRNLDLMQLYGQKQMDPVGNLLDKLVKEDVVKEGTGLTLGVTSTMMKFLQDPGPYIGLRHAQEVGTENDPATHIFCTLCKVQNAANNYHLHFTSSAHRTNVLRNDYPDKRTLLNQLHLLPRGEMNKRLKEIAAEIEKEEGRKVELIQRKIVRRGNTSQYGNQSYNQNSPRGGYRGGRGFDRGGRGTDRGGRGSYRGGRGYDQGGPNTRGGRGFDRGGGRGGRGGRGSQSYYTPYGLNANQDWSGSSSAPSDSEQDAPGYGSSWRVSQRGRGRGGRGRGGYSQNQSSGGRDFYSQDRGRGGGRGRDHRYHPYARAGSASGVGRYGERGGAQRGRGGGGWSQGGGGGSGQWQDQSTFYEDDYSQDYSSDRYQGAGIVAPPAAVNVGYTPAQMGPPPNPTTIQHQMTLEKLKSETGDKTEAFKALAMSMINSEESADDAFQLSSALTQALMDYRMKALGTMVPETPISSLLGILQKNQQPPPPPPQKQ